MKMVNIVFMVAITIALTITLTMKNLGSVQDNPPSNDKSDTLSKEPKILMPSKRVSRFLADQRNPRAADHCHKDNDICYVLEGVNSTCCNNKCMDLREDAKNCGACKKKCQFTEQCCRGECVNLAYDKRHCGVCNHRCMPGGYCIYGICDYA
ncbi:hypothetical protein RJ640_004728 [Escallonia rubra]|uniref:Stigma-specific Stig1 family protein n=1 Tax=Escallonia rubra TaxID=112253 RepID=A0AA88U701_9ASTE|nr:hypothetical protein RJ640_004728 [Escallonia rubra]